MRKRKNKCCILMHIHEIEKNGTDDPICRAGIETQTSRLDWGTQQGKARVGQMESAALAYIHYHVWQRRPEGSCSATQKGQLHSAMAQRGGRGCCWEGGSRGRRHVYIYSRFTLLYGRNTTLQSNYPPIKNKLIQEQTNKTIGKRRAKKKIF